MYMGNDNSAQEKSKA